MDMAAHIKKVVAELGPPTPEQIARLRLIIWGTLHPTAIALPALDLGETTDAAA